MDAVEVLVPQDCRTQSTRHGEGYVSKGIKNKSYLHPDNLSSLCEVHLWLNLESVHPYFAAIISLSVCFMSEVRALHCVAVYQSVSSAFDSRKREY